MIDLKIEELDRAFKTEDGMVFDDENEASKHAVWFNIRSRVAELLYDNRQRVTTDVRLKQDEGCYEKAHFVFDHRLELKHLLNSLIKGDQRKERNLLEFAKIQISGILGEDFDGERLADIVAVMDVLTEGILGESVSKK